MQAAMDELDARGIGWEFDVRSAHRMPDAVAEYAKNAAQRGLKVLICGAGLAAALPGVVAAHTQLPGIALPPRSSISLRARLDPPLDARPEDGRLYGRGSYDMKGALAAAMLAVADAAARGLAGDVILTAVADEEVASLGTEAVLGRVVADAAIVCEPTELQVAIAHRGFAGFEIETHGVAAHGSRPDLGVDAIAKMGHVLVALEELDRRLQSSRRHPLVGSGSLHASLIEGGQEFSSYPERCLLTGDRRTLPGETRADIEGDLRAAA